MKRVSKIVLVVLTALLFMFTAVGCMIKPPEETQTEINTALPSTHVGNLTVATNPMFLNDIDKVRKEFNKVYPNIKVIIRSQPDVNQTIVQWYNADRVSPGSCPDIFWLSTSSFSSLASGGILKSLDEYLEAAKAAGTFDESNIRMEMFDLGKIGFKEEGEQYLMPTNYDQFVSYINTKIFEEAGIVIGNRGTAEMTFTYTPLGGSTAKMIKANEWTWAEFEEIAKVIAAFYKTIGWADIAPVTTHINSESMITPILKSFGAEVFDEEGNLILDQEGNKEKVVQALEFMYNVCHDGYAKYIADGALTNGNIAIHFQSRPGLIVPDKTPGKEFPDPGYFGADCVDVVPFPAIIVDGINKPSVGAGSHGYAMYRYTSNPNEAWAFMQFLFTEEGQNALGESGLHVPMLKSMTENTEGTDWNWLKYPSANMNHGAFISYPERIAPTVFQAALDTKIQQDALTAYLVMAQKSAQDGAYEANITECVSKIKDLMRG